MKVMNLLTEGGIGGIEVLCKDIGSLAKYENVFCFMSGEGPIYEQMIEMGINAISLVGGCKLSIRKIKGLKKLAESCDVIIAHHGDPYLDIYFCCLKLLYPHKRYARAMHSCFSGKSDDDGNVKYFIRKLLRKKAIDCSDACIFVSEAGRQSYLKVFRNVSHKPSYVIYNGIGMEKLEQGRKNIPKRNKPIHILYVGRLNKGKGISLLLDAVAVLKKEYNINLTVVGDGPERENLHRQAEKLNLFDNIFFIGQKIDIVPYLKNGDIFVYPSVWEEVFGIAIVEAMAFGLICIANRVGGIPEIIQDGVNGFLTSEKSREGIVDALKKAINIGEEEEASMRSAAKETAERLSIITTVSNMTDVLEKIVTVPTKNIKTN